MDLHEIQQEYARAYREGDEAKMEECHSALISLGELQLVRYKLEKYKLAG